MTTPKKLNPSLFGLPSRTILKEKQGGIILLKMRKSRIIMKDGEKIKGIKEAVMKTEEYTSFTLRTNAPICSKTRGFLRDEGILIEETDNRG